MEDNKKNIQLSDEDAEIYRNKRRNLEQTDNIKLPKMIYGNILYPADKYDKIEHEKRALQYKNSEEFSNINISLEPGIVYSSPLHKVLIVLLDLIQQQHRLYKHGELRDFKVIIDKDTNYERLIINSVDFAALYHNKKRVGGKEVRDAFHHICELLNYSMFLFKEGKWYLSPSPFFIATDIPLFGDIPKNFVLCIRSYLVNTDKDFILIPRNIAADIHKKSPLYICLLYFIYTQKNKVSIRIQKDKLLRMVARYKRYNKAVTINKDYENAIQELINNGTIVGYEELNKYNDTYAIFRLRE